MSDKENLLSFLKYSDISLDKCILFAIDSNKDPFLAELNKQIHREIIDKAKSPIDKIIEVEFTKNTVDPDNISLSVKMRDIEISAIFTKDEIIDNSFVLGKYYPSLYLDFSLELEDKYKCDDKQKELYRLITNTTRLKMLDENVYIVHTTDVNNTEVRGHVVITREEMVDCDYAISFLGNSGEFYSAYPVSERDICLWMCLQSSKYYKDILPYFSYPYKV